MLYHIKSSNFYLKITFISSKLVIPILGRWRASNKTNFRPVIKFFSKHSCNISIILIKHFEQIFSKLVFYSIKILTHS